MIWRRLILGGHGFAVRHEESAAKSIEFSSWASRHDANMQALLKAMLAGREILTEELLPEFQLTVSDLFYTPHPQS